MASTFTTNLNLELQGTSDNSGTWGSVLNAAVFTIIDQAMGGVQTLSLAGSNVSVSTAQSQNNIIKLTGTLLANIDVTFPAIGRTYFIANNTTGSFSVTIKCAGGGSSLVLPQGIAAFILLDGTNVLAASIFGSTILLKQGSAPTPTQEGDIQWDTDDDRIVVGDGSGTKLFSDDSKLAVLAATDQVITGGALVTPLSLGTITTGTVTLDPGDRALQSYTNGGAHTLAPGSNNGYLLLDITNNGSAGAITTSGWTKVVGAFTTTNGHKFRCGCSISTAGSLLTIQAMQ